MELTDVGDKTPFLLKQLHCITALFRIIFKFTFERAWSQYTTVSDSFSLDGSIESWLACAIYSACSTIPTTTMNGKEILGNCISLTRLLSGTRDPLTTSSE